MEPARRCRSRDVTRSGGSSILTHEAGSAQQRQQRAGPRCSRDHRALAAGWRGCSPVIVRGRAGRWWMTRGTAMSAAVQMAARKLVCVRQLGSTTESAKNGCSSEDLQKSAASGGATGGGGGIDPPRFAFDRSAVIMSPTLADLALHAGIPGKFRGSCPWWRVKTATLRAKIESWRLLVVRASPPPGLQRRPRQQANMRIFLLRFSKRHTLTQPGYG